MGRSLETYIEVFTKPYYKYHGYAWADNKKLIHEGLSKELITTIYDNVPEGSVYRILHYFYCNSICSIKDVKEYSYDDLMDIRNFGKKTVELICSIFDIPITQKLKEPRLICEHPGCAGKRGYKITSNYLYCPYHGNQLVVKEV